MSIKLNAQSGGSVALDAPTQTTSSADVAFKLPVADGSAGQVLMTDGSGNLSWVTLPTPGITEADQWRYTSDVSMGQYAANLVTDWERNDTEFTRIGTGMSVNTTTGQSNSGHWTFPSTGIWLIQVHWQGQRASGANHFAHHYIFAMNDGVQSNGFELASSSVGNGSNDNRNTGYMSAIFDCTNTSTHRVLFGYYDTQSQNTTYKGSSSHNQNSYTFIKLGET